MQGYNVIGDFTRVPMVSIAMLTYNHELYIGQAIESVLMQKVDFEYKLVIAEDCSTDNTRQVILDYQKRYPQKIKLVLQNENVGASQNNKDLFANLEGKYIAALEGDDFWTDSLKLQKQVDFLNQNMNFNICFHRAEIVYDTKAKIVKRDINEFTKQVTTLDDILPDNYIHTPTVLFRNPGEIPNWFSTAFPGDWVLHILSATRGKIYFMDEVMAVYRVHAGGVHSMKAYSPEKGLPTIRNIATELKKRGFPKQAGIMKARYDINYATLYGLENSGKVSMNRFKRSWTLLVLGNLKMKCLFFLPILLGNKTYSFWRKLADMKK